MRIEGDTIHFKTGPDWFSSEKSGLKPFTVRLVSEQEWDEIEAWWISTKIPRDICISSSYSGDRFSRPIIMVGKIGELAGGRLIFVRWATEGEGEGR